MGLREKLIEVAASQKGVKEDPAGSNKTKYGEWFGFNGAPWCAIFVSWVYAQAGKPLGTIDFSKGFAGVPFGYQFWKKKGKLTTDPKPGDITLYDWDADLKPDHTGLFVAWVKKGETFNSWEGNTSAGNDSNGGQVQFRIRKVKQVLAFVNVID